MLEFWRRWFRCPALGGAGNPKLSESPPAPPARPDPLAAPLLLPLPPKAGLEFRYTPNFSPWGVARPINLIVLHATAGGYEGAVAWLCNGDRPSPTSAHYVVAKDGRAVQLVQENDVAWHAGYGSWDGYGQINQRSLGIELENLNTGADPYPEPLLATVLWLTVRACRRYGLPPERVVGHADVDPVRKTDPKGFPWAYFRAGLAVALQADPGETPA